MVGSEGPASPALTVFASAHAFGLAGDAGMAPEPPGYREALQSSDSCMTTLDQSFFASLLTATPKHDCIYARQGGRRPLISSSGETARYFFSGGEPLRFHLSPPHSLYWNAAVNLSQTAREEVELRGLDISVPGTWRGPGQGVRIKGVSVICSVSRSTYATR